MKRMHVMRSRQPLHVRKAIERRWFHCLVLQSVFKKAKVAKARAHLMYLLYTAQTRGMIYIGNSVPSFSRLC